MSAKRTPAPPPALPGFTFVDVLGSGGFADVYLFEQHLPRRRVAVKVMLPEKMAGASAEEFTAEANVMALLSTHPAIVTIYQAGVSDDRRPYLVMEYCPKPNLQVRSRAAALSVAEALRIGIQVAAAVETAHRAGILHRDIKPANILVTEYNRPALTDFGIATTTVAADPTTGMSIPWSPPESFADVPQFTVRSDVYALGATLYTLLAGRSPFEVPGGRNGGADLIQRIDAQPAARLERTDAPESLQLVLERALAKRPADRYDTAIAFARALQKVQIELSHSVTPIDILDDAPDAAEPDDEDGELTRVRGIVSIDPQTAPAAGLTRDRSQTGAFAPETTGAASAPEETVVRGGSLSSPAVDTDATIARRPASVPPDSVVTGTPRAFEPGAYIPRGQAPASPAYAPVEQGWAAPEQAAATAPRRRRTGLWVGIGVAGAAVVIAGGVTAASLLSPQPGPSASAPGPSADATDYVPQDPLGDRVPVPTDLAGHAQDGEVVFQWTNPDPQDGDSYLWRTFTLTEESDQALITEPTITVPADPSGTTCVSVTIRRDDGTTGEPAEKCVPSS